MGGARTLAERTQASLHQPVMIENIDGAAGSSGTGRLARAAPHGYTLGIGYWGIRVANGALYPLTYDVVSDFEPIALLVESPLLIVASKATPANDLRELVGWLQQNPTSRPGRYRARDSMSPACSSRGRPGRISDWCPIGTPVLPSKTWRPGGSTWRCSI